VLGLLLFAGFVADALDQREMLVAVRAALPPSLAPERLAVLPMLGWVVLYCLVFITLLLYSVSAPTSLGASEVRFGSGYGRQRLALVLVLFASAVHLTLVQRIGEDHAIELLDMLKGHGESMSLRQRSCQVLLVLALLCELLLWVEHAEWGVLLLLYGLWAQHSFSSRHLAAFTSILFLSVCTDSLAIASGGPRPASGYATALVWGALVCKLVALSTLAFQ